MSVHICAPPVVIFRRVTNCPTCKQRRRFAGQDAGWWGVTWTCCACGDSWGEGERLERPFARGWRVEAAKRAKRDWAAALPRDEAMRQVMRNVGLEDVA